MDKEEKKIFLLSSFIQEIKGIILTAHTNAVRGAGFCHVQMHRQMERCIFGKEQKGKEHIPEYKLYLPNEAPIQQKVTERSEEFSKQNSQQRRLHG